MLDNKRVLAPQKDILEVQNAIKVYEQLHSFNPNNLKDLEKAHKILMKGLIKVTGKLRTKNIGILNGSDVAHLAPSGDLVSGLMKDLFNYLKNDKDLALIKSCVFHYEFEFMLGLILQSLVSLLKSQNRSLSVADRIELFKNKVGTEPFARKVYLQTYKNISEPTASRDLKWAVNNGILEKKGANRLTKYKFSN